MPDPSPHIFAAARAILDAERSTADCKDAVGAIELAFSHLDQLMVGLIGPSGFNAVVARSAYLLRSRWPWLEPATIRAEASIVITGSAPESKAADAVAKVTARVFFTELRKVAADRGEAEVVEAASALLAHVIRLLTEFIGDDLTFRLLRRVWVNLPTTVQGSDPEQK